MAMDPTTVERLEEKTEEAIALAVTKMGMKELPLLPSQRTMYLMVKAAVAVYEAASDGYNPSNDRTAASRAGSRSSKRL